MALKDISPISIVWLRFTMGIVILGIAVAIRKQKRMGLFRTARFSGNNISSMASIECVANI